jgi:hypothetical protein
MPGIVGEAAGHGRRGSVAGEQTAVGVHAPAYATGGAAVAHIGSLDSMTVPKIPPMHDRQERDEGTDPGIWSAADVEVGYPAGGPV